MGLQKVGGDPEPYLHPNIDTSKMKQKYNLQHTVQGFLIAPIEEKTVRFATKILSCKLLRKMRSSECTAIGIELAE